MRVWVTSATVGPWDTQVAWTGRTASASRWREGPPTSRRLSGTRARRKAPPRDAHPGRGSAPGAPRSAP